MAIELARYFTSGWNISPAMSHGTGPNPRKKKNVEEIRNVTAINGLSIKANPNWPTVIPTAEANKMGFLPLLSTNKTAAVEPINWTRPKMHDNANGLHSRPRLAQIWTLKKKITLTPDHCWPLRRTDEINMGLLWRLKMVLKDDKVMVIVDGGQLKACKAYFTPRPIATLSKPMASRERERPTTFNSVLNGR